MESMDFTMLQAVFWYAMGIISYKIVAKALNITMAATIFNEALISSLSLLKNASDNYDLVSQQSFDKLLELDEEKAKEQIEKDKQALQFWQRLVVLNIKNLTPTRLRSITTFKDWQGAMKHLKKGIKNV